MIKLIALKLPSMNLGITISERKIAMGGILASIRTKRALALRLLLAAVGLAALAACEPTTTATGGMVQTASGPVDPAAMIANAPPMGTALLDQSDALLAYQTICLDTLPRFAGAEEVVKRRGMAKNPTTGTWYDPNRELSVNLLPRGGRPVCSIVFASNESPQMLSLTLGIGTASGRQGSPEIGIDPERGTASTSTDSGGEMFFETGIGGRSNLHRVVLFGPR